MQLMKRSNVMRPVYNRAVVVVWWPGPDDTGRMINRPGSHSHTWIDWDTLALGPHHTFALAMTPPSHICTGHDTLALGPHHTLALAMTP